MPIKATANGKTFTFPNGTSQEDMAAAIDNYFASSTNAQAAEPQPELSPKPVTNQPVTGDNPMDLASLKSVYEAPELGGLSQGLAQLQQSGGISMGALKAGLGGLLTGNPEELAGIIESQIPDAKVDVNSGIVQLPSGNYQLESSAPARFVFDLASFMTGGPITGPLKKRMGKEAARAMGVETLQQTGEEALGGEFDGKDVALAGATDVIGGTVGEVLSGTLRGIMGNISEEAAGVLKSGEKAGVPVMTSDVLPPRTFMSKSLQTFYERIPVLGTGGRREFQKAAREGALDKLAADFGVTPNMPVTDEVIDSLGRVKTERISAASALKRQSQDTLSTAGQVPRDSFTEAVKNAIETESKFGAKADQELMSSLQDWLDVPAGDFKFMDELRSRLGDEISDYYTGKNSQIGSKGVGYLQSLKDALTRDMENFATAQNNPAMSQAARDWKRANAMFFDEYSKYKDSALRTMLDKGEVKPEIIMPILRGNAPSQAKLLYDNLDPAGRNAAKASILQDILQRSAGSPEKLTNALDKLEPNLRVFFRGDDMKVLEGYKKLFETTQRGAVAGARTPTGQELYPLALGAAGYGAVQMSPGLAALGATTALGGRVFESGPVRNSLLKLANTPAGSAAYDRILRDVIQQLKSSSQALRDEEE